jgi:hypothetical protein
MAFNFGATPAPAPGGGAPPAPGGAAAPPAAGFSFGGAPAAPVPATAPAAPATGGFSFGVSTPAAGSEIHDNPDYIAPSQQDMLLMDVTSLILHTRISEELEVAYLSKVDSNAEKQRSPLDGRLYGLNKRLMVNVVTRRMSRRKSTEPDFPSYNIIFLCDTGSPNTFICEEAMLILMKGNSENVAPKQLFVKMADFPAVEAHTSPNPSHYTDVNVIGMDLLCQLQTTIFGKDLEFQLANMEHR